jgi:hypothetical protein
MAHRTPTKTAALLVPALALLASCSSSGTNPPAPAAAPAISSISPTLGPTAGGTPVTLLGANFAAGVQVAFGTSPATVLSVNGGSIVIASTPAHPAGAVDVKVTNPDGQQATRAAAFNYQAPPPPAAPIVTAVSPGSGALGGGTTVTISGANFVAGTGLAVRFDGLDATSITAVLPGAITAVTPAHAAGAVAVQVVNPDGQSNTLPGGFTYLASPPPPGLPPVLTSIAPTAGTTAGGSTVVLTGQNFVPGAGLVVLFGGTAATVTPGSVTATSITVTTPAHAAGAVDVTVVNPDGQSVTDAGAFTYQTPPPPPPVVTGITPASGPTAGGTSVTLTGSGFVTGATVFFGATPVTPSSVTALSIALTTPARAAGAADVTVRNPDGQSSAPVTFTYVGPSGPTITSLSRTSGVTTGGELCVVAGSGFVTGSTVTFGGTPASLVAGTAVTATAISVSVPAHAVGVVDVTVTNPGGAAATLANGYTYVGPAPVVLALNVRGGPTAGGTQVLAVGSGFVPGVSVTVGGTPATNVSLVSAGVGSTAVSFFTPPKPEGLYDVIVTNPDGQADLAPVQFHYGPAPVVTAVSCSGGCATVRRDDVITLSGDHFSVGAGQGVQVIFASVDTGQQAFATVEAVPTPTATQFSVRAPKLDGGLCANPPRPCRYSLVVNNFDGQTGVAPTQVTYQ